MNKYIYIQIYNMYMYYNINNINMYNVIEYNIYKSITCTMVRRSAWQLLRS